ncbi:hypothetical protein COV61_00150 [Candidatus Micrarchaeota archaeon CG11_big_fil_rev_8_21_14_0_20_47_5]|nr:MAG: hypothetical protein AUJ17_05265 [Candidatus Micrarchaeota archaeon CG1_02_47_40]PIN84438.1 MAG: hypothetical protein COV61_00150 [Candidatus Micrarchaeota archaeon CG11_big_fil_rev_8_21_14_0_20_47_5]
MSGIFVHLEGSVEQVLNRLLDAGFFKTKAEAVRAGILELGKDYHVVKSNEEILDELAVAKMEKMQEELKSGGKRTLTLNEVRKKYPEAF